jgi:DNA modification methylase
MYQREKSGQRPRTFSRRAGPPRIKIADLIRDCSRRNGVILDPFGGSGTTILVAERTGRIARVLEWDPLYVDVAIRRWQKITGITARHTKTGLTFAEMQAQQATSAPSVIPTRRTVSRR